MQAIYSCTSIALLRPAHAELTCNFDLVVVAMNTLSATHRSSVLMLCVGSRSFTFVFLSSNGTTTQTWQETLHTTFQPWTWKLVIYQPSWDLLLLANPRRSHNAHYEAVTRVRGDCSFTACVLAALASSSAASGWPKLLNPQRAHIHTKVLRGRAFVNKSAGFFVPRTLFTLSVLFLHSSWSQRLRTLKCFTFPWPRRVCALCQGRSVARWVATLYWLRSSERRTQLRWRM